MSKLLFDNLLNLSFEFVVCILICGDSTTPINMINGRDPRIKYLKKIDKYPIPSKYNIINNINISNAITYNYIGSYDVICRVLDGLISSNKKILDAKDRLKSGKITSNIGYIVYDILRKNNNDSESLFKMMHKLHDGFNVSNIQHIHQSDRNINKETSKWDTLNNKILEPPSDDQCKKIETKLTEIRGKMTMDKKRILFMKNIEKVKKIIDENVLQYGNDDMINIDITDENVERYLIENSYIIECDDCIIPLEI